jgi:hypothetical protein
MVGDWLAIILTEIAKLELSAVDLPVYSNLPSWSKEHRVPLGRIAKSVF